MGLFDAIISKIPGVQEPTTHLNFKSRLIWTILILLSFLLLGQITVYGISPQTLQQFQFFELILGSSMGSLMTLGIGPIVTSSIILQLMMGAGILPWNTKTQEGRKKFQGTQKLLTVFFALFEAYAFVAFGAIKPINSDFFLFIFLIMQLAFGALLTLLMDEVINKWGIGSGISLFIAAGVTKTIFVRAFNPITPAGETVPAGILPQFVALIGLGELNQALLALLPIFSTILIFLIVVYVQAIRVEVPLAYASLRGFSRRWPLNLIYTSNIPVILISALLANLQLLGNVTARTTDALTGLRCGPLGCFDQSGSAVKGIVQFFLPPSTLSVHVFFIVLLGVIFVAGLTALYFQIKNPVRIIGLAALVGLALAFLVTATTVGLPDGSSWLRVLAYMVILIIGSVIFSVFWVSTSGMDAKSVSEQIEGIGMQIPGFRRDPRIIEQVLGRYIPPLSVISGFFIGTLAAVADFTGALGTGTGILLTVTIVYGLYENIASRYLEDMNPALRKFFG